MLKDVVGRRSKTPTWACAQTHHVGLCEFRPTRRHVSNISNFSAPDQWIRPYVFSMLKDVVGRWSKTPTWAYAQTHHVGLCEYRPTRRHVSNISNFSAPDQWVRPCEVFKAQRCCRSAVEDLDMGLCPNPSCRTLRVPTYEKTCLKHFKLQRAGSMDSALCFFQCSKML